MLEGWDVLNTKMKFLKEWGEKKSQKFKNTQCQQSEEPAKYFLSTTQTTDGQKLEWYLELRENSAQGKENPSTQRCDKEQIEGRYLQLLPPAKS
jgi:hypothetical protein